MRLTVRQSVLCAIIGTFLLGNFLLAAALWSTTSWELLVVAADGTLVAEPMLLAMWLGLARQPVGWRLTATLALSLVGTLAFIAGIALSRDMLRFDICVLFLTTGIGATVLGGGFFRAHRFLVGVLTTDREPSQAEDASRAGARAEPPSSRELQFGVGYILAMTSAIAIVISLLRWLVTFTEIHWGMVLLFGWTFFVYSMVAALVTLASVLAAKRRRTHVLLVIAYTLLAPLAAIFVVGVWEQGQLGFEQFINLYAYALSLAATLALVAYILRRLGYRLRGGRL